MRNLILVLAVIVLLVADTASRAQTLFQRFAGVKTWELRYSYRGSGPYTWEEGGKTTNRYVYDVASSGRIMLERENETPESQFVLRGKGPVAASLNERSSTAGVGNYLATRYDVGAGTGSVAVDVEMNLEEGTYHISIMGANDFPVTYGGTEKWSFNDKKYGPVKSEYAVRVPYPAPAQLVLKLPEGGRVISGSWSHEQELAHAKKDASFDEKGWFKDNLSAGSVQWTLVPADPVDVELQVEIDGYADWMPLGSLDQAKAGTTLRARATLVAKNGGGPPSQKAVRMTYALSDASRERGVCLNWPQTDADTAADLRFEADKNAAGWTVGGDGTSIASPDGEHVETAATLSSFDFGAYGTLLVTAELQDGSVVVGYLKDDAQRGDILLPKRAADSKIADKWKELTKFTGQDTDDADEQKGNAKPGDGLTAYEEYRGLVALGKPTRTTGLLDPNRKDLAVLNKIGREARGGLDLFTAASGIGVVELKEGELPESRRLNLNNGTATGGEQHAIRLVDEALPRSAGENRPADLLGKTPKKSIVAVVDMASAKRFYEQQLAISTKGGERLPYTLEEDIANTVAHEVAHGVGAPHHGKQTEFFDKRVLTPRMTDWRAYGQDGVELLHATKDYTLEGNIGRPGNDASGDAGCVMAYTNYYHWSAVGPTGGPLTYYAVPPQPVGKRFCTSPAATGINLPHTLPNGSEIPGFFGPAVGQGGGAPVGNCLGAMNVRDW